MQEMRAVTGGVERPNIFEESNGRGLPTRTFTDRMTLGTGDERIELYHFGRAHTDGDTWVVFPASRVLLTGDVFAWKAFPIVDTNNGGSGAEYAETIAKAVTGLPDIDAVVTSHYPRALAMTDLVLYGEFVRGLGQAVQSAKTSGQTIDDFVDAWQMPERFLRDGYIDAPVRSVAERLWNETR